MSRLTRVKSGFYISMESRKVGRNYAGSKQVESLSKRQRLSRIGATGDRGNTMPDCLHPES